MTGYNVEPVVASETAVIDAIAKYYGKASAPGGGGNNGPSRPHRARSRQQGARGDAVAGRRRRRRGPRGVRRNQRRGARQTGRGSAGHQAGQRHPDVRDSEGRERHSHRALREGAARPLPHRRHSLQHHAAADEVPRRDHLAHQDHVQAGHRREAAAAGRPHQDPLPGRRRDARHRLPRLVSADALRREDRAASPRQDEADARHDQARVRAGVVDEVRGGDRQAMGHGPGHRTDRDPARRTRSIHRSRGSTQCRRTS